MNTNEIKVGQMVESPDGTVKVTNVAKGWVTTVAEDGSEHKYRAGVLNLLEEPTIDEHEEMEEVSLEEAVAEGVDEEEDDFNGKQGSVISAERKATYAKYQRGKTRSSDCADDVALKLRAMDLEGVYKVAAKVENIKVKELTDAYEHLNPGMQRMNLGNRIRKWIKVDPANLNKVA